MLPDWYQTLHTIRSSIGDSVQLSEFWLRIVLYWIHIICKKCAKLIASACEKWNGLKNWQIYLTNCEKWNFLALLLVIFIEVRIIN